MNIMSFNSDLKRNYIYKLHFEGHYKTKLFQQYIRNLSE